MERDMSTTATRSLTDILFEPRSIAIVGASNDPAKISGRPLDYLLKLGYQGRVYAVNPTRDVVQGVPSFPSVSAIGEPIDLALIVTPAARVADAARDCAAAGAGAAIVFASGFSEARGTGKPLQAELDDIVRTSRMRLVGPNCLGTFALPQRAFATFSSAFDNLAEVREDPIALVSQSGAVGTFTYSSLVAAGVGLRYFANTGNEGDVTVPELLLALALRDDVSLLIAHLEGLRSPETLAAAARVSLASDKPLVVIKAGRTAEGRRAVAAHTASVATEDDEFAELVAGSGIIRAPGMEAAVDAVVALRNGRRARGRRLSIVTISGGAAALATDAAVEAGLVVDEWPESERAAIDALIPSFGSSANPMDLTGALLTDNILMDRVLSQVTMHDLTDMVLVVLGNADRGSEQIVEGVRRVYLSTDKPMVVVWTGGSGVPRAHLISLGIPTYTDLAHVAHFSEAHAAAL
jgi:acetate---CoA ligase (ADP-forming)